MTDRKPNKPWSATHKDVYIAVEMVTKEWGRGANVAEIAEIVFKRAVSSKTREYASVYNRLKGNKIFCNTAGPLGSGSPDSWYISAAEPSNGGGPPKPERPVLSHNDELRARLGVPPPVHPDVVIHSDELRARLGRLVDALETLQENINPTVALLLDLEKDYERFTKGREALALLRSQIAEVSF